MQGDASFYLFLENHSNYFTLNALLGSHLTSVKWIESTIVKERQTNLEKEICFTEAMLELVIKARD